MVRDIVCGIDLEEQNAYAQGLYSRFEGNTYYFCCDECMQLFEQNPSQFVGPAIDAELPEVTSSSAPTAGLSGAARSLQKGSSSRPSPSREGERKKRMNINPKLLNERRSAMATRQRTTKKKGRKPMQARRSTAKRAPKHAEESMPEMQSDKAEMEG